jgi:exopolysaccharide biosynthesis polyprenyl glycosylphosphotransferase
VADVPAQLTLSVSRRHGLAISERRLLLAAFDMGAVGTAFIAAFNLYTAQVRGEGFYVPRTGTLIAAAAWFLSAQMTGAFDLRTTVLVRPMVRAVSTTLAASFAALLAVFFLTPYRITRPTLVLWLPLAFVLVIGGRLLYRRVFAGGYLAGRIALVAPREAMETVWPEVGRELHGLYRVAAVIDPRHDDAGERLRKAVVSRDIDQVVLGVRDDLSRDLFRAAISCHDAGVAVRSLADLYEEITGRLLLDQLGHTWLVSLPMRSDTSRLYRLYKRTFDVVAAGAALLVLAVALLPVAFAVLVTDRGPVFHSQVRVGKYGRTFKLWKLRTMRDAPSAPLEWTSRRDPRITPVGRVLRRLHLDELPQVWSILRGDMSLVGPRPEQPHYVETLRSDIDFYNTRLTVRPGLTGWAQVNYGYGSGTDGARVKLSYDLYYIKRQSVSLDMLILGRTLVAVLSLGGR